MCEWGGGFSLYIPCQILACLGPVSPTDVRFSDFRELGLKKQLTMETCVTKSLNSLALDSVKLTLYQADWKEWGINQAMIASSVLSFWQICLVICVVSRVTLKLRKHMVLTPQFMKQNTTKRLRKYHHVCFKSFGKKNSTFLSLKKKRVKSRMPVS